MARELRYISLMFANTAGAGAGIAVVLFFIIGAGIYFIPTIVAYTRKVTNVGSVFVINFLLGWTLIGWAVALAMAVKTNMTQVHVVTSTVDTYPRQAMSTIDSSRPTPPESTKAVASNAPTPSDQETGSTTWCDTCNKELRESAKFCPQCGRPSHEVNLYECVDCRSPITLDDKFCPACGSSV